MSALSPLTNLTAAERAHLAPVVAADPELADALRAAVALGGASAAMAVLRARGLIRRGLLRLGAPDPEAARAARRRRKARRRWAEEVEHRMPQRRER